MVRRILQNFGRLQNDRPTRESVKWIIDLVTLEERSEDMEEYVKQVNQRNLGCSVILSVNSYLCPVPQETMVGDVIVILYGLSTPAILQNNRVGTIYRLEMHISMELWKI